MLNYSIDPQHKVVPYYEYDLYLQGNLPEIPESKTMNPNKTYLKTWYEDYLKVEEDKNIFYKLNKHGHRSEDFKVGTGFNVLFAGDSFTFGEGLPYMKNWSGYLFEKIKNKNNKLSSYQSLSYLGGSTELIVNNIYKYFNSFGNPDVIFMLIPEFCRHVAWQKNEYHSIVPDKFYSSSDKNNLIYKNYNAIRSLEIYCKNMGIKLIWSSWADHENALLNSLKFENYVSLTEYLINENAKNYDEETNDYFYAARDKNHPGLIYSDGLSNIFLNVLYPKRKLFNKKGFIY
jgi:hypothetical protein